MGKRLRHHYSQDLSRGFWDQINKIADKDEARWHALYDLGIELQNLEEIVLAKLAEEQKDG